MKKKISLMHEILTCLVGSVVVVALVLGISFIFLIQSIVRTSTVNAVSQTMETLNAEVSGILGEYNDMVVNLSNVIPALEDREQMKAVIQSMGRGLPSDTLLYYATAEQIWDGGTLISHSGWEASPDFDMQSRLWHKNAMNNPTKLCYTEPFTDVNTGKTIVTISYRVLGPDGRTIGVSAFDIVLDALSEAVRTIRISPNSKMNIITKDGMYLTNDGSSNAEQNYFDNASFTTFSRGTYLAGEAKSFIEGRNFYGMRQIAGTDWFIVAEGPVSDFSGDTMKVVFRVFAAVAIIFLLVLAFGVILTRKIMGSLKTIRNGIMEFADQIASGKADLSRRISVNAKNEVGDVADGFNVFSEKLQDIISNMKKSKSALLLAGDSLNGGTQDTASAIEQIASSISGVEKHIAQQNESVGETADAMQAILSDIHALEKLVGTQSEVVQTASGAVEQMIGNISEVNRSVDKMATSFGALATDAESGAKTQTELQNQISEIEEQSKLLNEANSVISSIAEQTNLLAMNAAIEAAHAGEAGKGFAVVADEIRKLSETSSSQSKTIGEQLGRIQNTISELVVSTQNGVQGYAHLADEIRETDGLVQQIKAAMSEQQAGSAQITDSLRDMNDSTHKVQDASKKMAAESQTIIGEVGSLQEKSASMKQAMSEMANSAEKIKETGSALSEISAGLERSIIEIGKQVDQFEV